MKQLCLFSYSSVIRMQHEGLKFPQCDLPASSFTVVLVCGLYIFSSSHHCSSEFTADNEETEEFYLHVSTINHKLSVYTHLSTCQRA